MMSMDFPMFDFEGDSVWTLTRCPLCNDKLTDPRILPCLHSFCLDCLYDYQSGDICSKNKEDDSQGSFFNAFVHKFKSSISPVPQRKETRIRTAPIREECDLSCPVCHKDINIPEEGLEGLKKNLFLQKMLEVQKITEGEEKLEECEVKCDVCGDMAEAADTDSDAVMFCVDCSQNLCQKCSDYHRLLKNTTTHRLLSIGSEQELIKRMEVLKCTKHPNEKMEVYCKTCQISLCQTCFSSSDHTNHSGCGLTEASTKLKEVIEESIDDFSYDISSIRKHLRDVDEVSDRFTTNIEHIENSVQMKEDEIRTVMVRHAAILKNEIEDRKSSFEKEIKKIRDGLESHQKMLEDYSSYTKTLLKKASAAVLVCSSYDVNRRLKELRKIRVSELTSEIEPTFVPSKIATEAVLGRKMSFCGGVGAGTIRNKLVAEKSGSCEDNLIGFLEFKTKYSKKSMGTLTLAKTPLLLSSMTFNEWTTCMAIVYDEDEHFLMLGTYASEDITFMSAKGERRSRRRKSSVHGEDVLKVEGLKNAYSMSVVQEYLFITEWNNDALHRIEVTIKDSSTSNYAKLSLGTSEGLNALSTTMDNKYLIVTCAEYDSIKLYNVDGVLKRSIRLEPSVDQPCDCIQLNDDAAKDTFVISQNDGNTNAATTVREESERWAVSHSGEHMDRVLLMDGSGKILATYGGLKGGSGGNPGSARKMSMHSNYQPSHHQQLNGPYRIFGDLINNYLFVSDHYNHRILLLNSLNLKAIRELIPPTFGLSYPLDIYFDAYKQLLHVADLDNKRFIMFSFE